MESPRRETERALVAKATLRGESPGDDPLAEITALARTAGADVVGAVTQRLVRPCPATYLGKGKVEEMAARAGELEADLVITDSDLSPAQGHNLEKLTARTVIDRSQLIMDIFSQRARTHQSKLQVELAQLRYSLPRLKRLWTHLSRLEGGIGMRGPGETQLEEDKRIIRRRIQKLERQLKKLGGRNETALSARRSEFVVALVGYTNAGKSTLLNRLTGAQELVEDKLFATLDTRVRRWQLEPHRRVLLTDTVGFIRDLPHHLVASFQATLSETQNANLLFHVVDCASSAARQQMETVRRVLRDLGCEGKETWVLFNKWDAVPPERLIEARHLESTLFPGERSFIISAERGDGLEALREALLARLAREEKTVELFVPHERGDVVAYVRENGRVLESEYRTDGVFLRAALTPARLAKLKNLLPAAFPGMRENGEDDWD